MKKITIAIYYVFVSMSLSAQLAPSVFSTPSCTDGYVGTMEVAFNHDMALYPLQEHWSPDNHLQTFDPSGVVHIEYLAEVRNIYGMLLHTFHFSSETLLNMSDSPNGLYIFTILDENGKTIHIEKLCKI